MSKFLAKLLILSILFGIFNFGIVHGSDSVTFSDPAFENAIKSALNTDEDITKDDLSQVTELLLESPGSLADLSKLPNVVSLDIYSSQTLKDHSALKNLKDLSRLCLKDCNVQNVGDVVDNVNSTKLERLGIIKSGLSGLNGLQNVQNLIQLELNSNNLNKIEEVKDLKKLILLNLRDNKIADLAPLKDLNKLTTLDLSNNNIKDVLPLDNLKSVTSLNLFGNGIFDFSPLSKMNKLKTFVYDSNPGVHDEDLRNHISVYVNNYRLPLDVYPVLRNGRVLIPFRALCEQIGATVQWNAENGQITTVKNNNSILIKVGSNKGYVNGKEKVLDVSPLIIESRTLVPVRFLSEALGCKVSWDNYAKKVDVIVKVDNKKASERLSYKNLKQELDSKEVTILEDIPYTYYINPELKIEALEKKIRLDWLSIEENGIIDHGDWLGSKGLSFPAFQVPNPFFNEQGDLPGGVPEKYRGQILVKAIECSNSIILIYGSHFASSGYLASIDKKTGMVKYIINLENIEYAPTNISKDLDFVSQSVSWAWEEGNNLYISRGHNTYSRSSNGMNAYITAIDTVSKKIIWNSQPLVSNSGNFEIIDDCIVSGYGFSDEADYLYVINKHDGKVIQKMYLETGPDAIIKKDEKLYVRAYSKNYVFDIIKY